MAWGSSRKEPEPGPEPEPRAWIGSHASEAKAARRRLLDEAALLPRQVHNDSPLSIAPYPLDTYMASDGQSTVLVPAQELVPDLLRSDTFIELSPERLNQANALSTKHPGVKTQMPDTKPQLRVITPAVAANLASAREAIDLVKALLPGGAGNQIKDLAATGGDSLLRSSLSHTQTDHPVIRAFLAIQWQGGYCDAQASLAYQLLSQNPALAHSRIDLVSGRSSDGNHTFVVIRGQEPEHDIVVDPWAPFASPTLVQDALPLHRTLLGAAGSSISHTKPAGDLLPKLEIKEALRRQAITQEQSPIRDRFVAEKFRDPESHIADHVKDPEDRWDVPFSGNPNVRYDVHDESGRRLNDSPIRFDMQRAASSAGPRQP